MSSRGGLLGVRRTLYSPQIAMLVVLGLGALTLVFGTWTATSAWSFPRFVVAVLALIYLPGKLVLDTRSLGLKPLEDLTLALVLGITSSSFVYWISAVVAVPYVFALWPLLAAAVYFYRRRKGWSDTWRRDFSVEISHVLLAGVVILGLIPLVALPMYYRNVAFLPEGGMTFLRRPRDAIFHLSIANELSHSIPPQVPFLAGKPLGYHYGMDLLVAMLSNSASLSVPDLTVRFVPTLLVITTLLAVFCFSRIWLRSQYAAVLSAFLVVLGEDLAFVPGLLLGSREIWSVQFFGAPTVYSLYFLNPMLPALAILFGGLFCLVKFCEEQGKTWLILTAFLLAVLVEYKVFVAVHAFMALAIAAVIYLALFRDRRLLKVLVLTGLLTAPLITYTLLGTAAGAGVWVRIDPWPYVLHSLEQLGLLDTYLGQQVAALWTRGAPPLGGLIAFFAVALPGYLLGSLGLRVIAIPVVIKELSFPRPPSAARFFVAVFVILGPLVTLTCTVTPRSYPPDSQYNEAIWFFVQSKYVVWIFVVESIWSFCRGRRRALKALIVVVIVGLSIPSTAEYFHSRMRQRLDILGERELELVGFLDQGCIDGGVVFSRQQVAAPVAALTRCRVPVLNIGSYTNSFVSVSELRERRKDWDDFWDAWNKERVRTDILERYKVGYVVVDKRVGDLAPERPLASQTHGQAADRVVSMETCFLNEDFVVYRVLADDEQPT